MPSVIQPFRGFPCLQSLGRVFALACSVVPISAWAQESDLWDLSFEELLQVEVSSASRQDESVWKTNASVSILTGRDLTDFSRMTLAEGLRQADGVDLGRVSASTWAISSRGLVGEYSNRQLVLVDDRQMYSSLVGGVMWDRVDTFLPDLKQVEIVRGAGGAAWGSNAVHGVINAISKPADETQGGLFYGTVGESGHQVGLRYGGSLGANTFARVFVKEGEFDGSVGSLGQDLMDDWRTKRAEFRVDHYGADWDYIFQGGGFENRRGQRFLVASQAPPFFDFVDDDVVESGHYLRVNGKSDSALGDRAVEWNVYLDDTDVSPFVVHERRRTLNGFLSLRDEIGRDWEGIASLDTRMMEITNVDNAFVMNRQNKFDVWKHGLNLRAVLDAEEGYSGSVGTRFEYNSESGLVVLPSARFAYEFSEKARLWGSYTRAARFPDEEKTRITSQIMYYPAEFYGPGTPEVFQVSRPNPDLSEELYDVIEFGSRTMLGDRVQLDGSVFHESMKDVIERVVGAVDLSTNPGYQYIDKVNAIAGETYGWELSARWDAHERLRLRGFYGTLRHSSGLEGRMSEMQAYAKHHAFIEAKSPLNERVNLGLLARYFDARAAMGLEDWIWLDASVSVRFGEETYLTISGENLLSDEQQETMNFNRFESSRFSSDWKLSVQLPF